MGEVTKAEKIAAKYQVAEDTTTSARLVPLRDVVPSKLNHRRYWRRIGELAASIEEHGQRTPGKARPHPTEAGKLELVYGERRMRALATLGEKRAAAGELSTADDQLMLLVIQDLTDHEVRIEQAVENLDREDPHPLEEALIYQGLMTRREDGGDGMSLVDVCDLLHKSREHVADRMRLVALCEEGRDVFLADEIKEGHAVLAARIIDHDLQRRFIKDILGTNDSIAQGRVMSVEQARQHAKRFFMMPLATAPFDPTAPALVQGVGPCGTCPKNSSAQRVLFRDVALDNAHCTDIPCFHSKTDAAWVDRASAARAAGMDVLSDEDAKAVWPWPNETIVDANARYYPLDQVTWETAPQQTWGALVALVEQTDSIKIARVLARKPHSKQVTELITRETGRTLLHRANDILNEQQDDDDDDEDEDDSSVAANGEATSENVSRPAKAPGSGMPVASAPAHGSKAEQHDSNRWQQQQADAKEQQRKRVAQFRATLQVLAVLWSRLVMPIELLLPLRAIASRFAANCLVEVAREVAGRRGLRAVPGTVDMSKGMRAEAEAALLAFISAETNPSVVLGLLSEMILAKDVGTLADYVGIEPLLQVFGVALADAKQGKIPEPPKQKARGREPEQRRSSVRVKGKPAPTKATLAKPAASRSPTKRSATKKGSKPKGGTKASRPRLGAPVAPARASRAEAPTCGVCGCSDEHPCKVGKGTCSWQNDHLCTVCGDRVDRLVEACDLQSMDRGALIANVAAQGEAPSTNAERDVLGRALDYAIDEGMIERCAKDRVRLRASIADDEDED